ncbi:asparagine synthase [Legionella pneumophila serogroup 1]|uniref:asparagine synthase-related protein n=1 Tax=Legionella pneumophila TaxID=446 RepID=UPI000770A35D|nr:asparagine synthase-related protein [Legionella pneumophila]HAT8946467.1 asparagine synthase [Legionella pneumophila subsp. pneumophila]MCH9060845.1 asparagine synthase [Legionella pneumophila serogroup 1]MCH9063896.1 asparagine synthase [Legionella pneumophila serogroup 1]MCH9066596.1 asparagine synthase [Legionella pneumophila serogroup 1]MCH9068778.1 asparagine synthase [Legionella pneumophila serogroup 1]
MNALYGVLRFDGQPFERELLERAKFNSPIWKADHSELYYNDFYATMSSQRFITPECALQTAPYYDRESGVIANGDLYLTNHSNLANQLGVSSKNSDLYLATRAYLKWGEKCVNYLAGNFFLVFYDLRKKRLFIAIDHFNFCCCYYLFVPGKYFIFSNTFNTFKVFHDSLAVNHGAFYKLAAKQKIGQETCLKSVKKLTAASYMIVSEQNLQEQQYWDLHKTQHPSHKSREDYYSSFRNEIQKSIRQSIRTDAGIMAHYSGGLDSSSIASIAALELAKENKTLLAYTAIPKYLSGDSHRAGCKYHELDRVQSACRYYDNIETIVYQSSEDMSIFDRLQPFYPYLDQPFKAVFNMEWILAGLEMAAAKNCRMLLNGEQGNASISWRGVTLGNYLNQRVKFTRHFLKYHMKLGKQFIKSGSLNLKKNRLHINGMKKIFLDPHYSLLMGKNRLETRSYMRSIYLWYGVEVIDPTSNLELVQFCYDLPEWIYHGGNKYFEIRRLPKLKRRLLVRDALEGLVPPEIRYNPYRGEQAADWYYQFNKYGHAWERLLADIAEKHPLIWEIYPKKYLLDLFANHPINPQSRHFQDVEVQLIPALSTAFFINDLNNLY